MSAQPQYEIAEIEAITYRTAPETRAAVERIAEMEPTMPPSVLAYRYRITHGSRPSPRIVGI